MANDNDRQDVVKRVAEFTISVVYDAALTDAESIASALDTLMTTALSTPGIFDDYGNPDVGEFHVQGDFTAEVSDGGAL